MGSFSIPPRLTLFASIVTCIFIMTTQLGDKVSQSLPDTPISHSVQRHFNSVAHHFSNSNAAPGFEDALPSCRLADMYQDPLVKEYGVSNIKLSRTYEGSGARVRRVLEKARRGEAIHIAAVGGSVSAGHAIRIPLTHENYMYPRIHHWFKQTFPEAEHVLDLGAVIPATTNLYLSYCLLEHLPLDVDLVFVDLDINSNPMGDESMLATDAVLRTILSLPSNPAVIYMSVMALSFEDMVHGWIPATTVTQWYDVPMINIRNFMLPHFMAHPEDHQRVFIDWANNPDLRHMNNLAHVALADMAIAYLREQLCILQRNAPEEPAHNPAWPAEDITTTLPRLDILSPWSADKVLPPFHPRCRSIISSHDPLVPIVNHGWTNTTHNEKYGWQATELGSEVTFEFETAAGLAGFWFWNTWDKSFASVDCWVDDATSPERVRRVHGYDPNMRAPVYNWSRNLWDDLTPGKHTLTCKTIQGLEGGNVFRISSTITR